jgi:UDP-N-acetylmuramoyl-tripeptide--D-alanyl-D-alanine ligase
VAILNADDRRVRRMARKTKARVVTFGRHASANVRALRISGDPLQGLRFTLIHGERQARVHLNMPGQHAVTTALAAAAAALTCGMTIEAVAAGLGELRVPKRRGEIKAGVAGITVIDDSYNANRQSVEAALDLLQSAKAGKSARRWAVLGDMFELGQFAAAEHSAVGSYAAGKADELVAVGGDARHVAAAARAAGMAPEHVHLFEADINDATALTAARDAAAQLIRATARPGDLVLIKGSLGMGMDSIVSQLVADAGVGGAQGGRGRGAARNQATSTTLADLDLVRQPRR